MSPDLPFVRREGDTEVIAAYNRIAAIERINYLSGINLADKPKEYKYLLDCEMYQKWYKDEPATLIDEIWCQRAAEIIKILEKEKDLNKILEEVPARVKQLYKEASKPIPNMPPEPLHSSKPNWSLPITSFFSIMGQSIKNVLRKKKEV